MDGHLLRGGGGRRCRIGQNMVVGVQAMVTMRRDEKGRVPQSIGAGLAQASLATHFYMYVRVLSHFLALALSLKRSEITKVQLSGC
jgi:hypothetical protein